MVRQGWREEEKGTEHSLKPAVASLSHRSAVSRQSALVLVFVSLSHRCMCSAHVSNYLCIFAIYIYVCMYMSDL